MWKRVSALSLVVVLAVACSPDDGSPESTLALVPGASSPVEAVEDVVGGLDTGDFDVAASLAVPGQSALASLVEGAATTDVADALEEGDLEIAANFWSGFAQGTGSFLAGTVTVIEGATVTQDGVAFEEVRVLAADGSERSVYVRDSDGYRIDLFASFGAGLADKMLAPTERLLTNQTADSQLVLARLRDSVPSWLVAAQSPDTSFAARQQILSLIEIITRVS